MWSVPAGRWRALAGYAGVAAEIAAAIVIGLLITVLVLVLDPQIARGSPQDAVGRITDLAPSAGCRPT
jgi:hypothetical protein